MDWKGKSFLILAIVLCLHSGLGHMYEVSSGSGFGGIHFNRQVQHHEDCTKGPDGKETSLISAERNWIHTGKKSTITLKCHVCAEKPYKVWWTKDNKIVRSSSGSRIRMTSDQSRHRLRQHHHTKPSHVYKLRIKAFRESDFGFYRCTIFHNKTKMQEGQEIQVSGVPYPPVFETPTTWSETEFVLSWRLNSSIHSSPIIDYQLEFRQSDTRKYNWISVNVPAHETSVVTDPGPDLLKNTQDYGLTSDGMYTKNDVVSDKERGFQRQKSKLYQKSNAPKLHEYRQTYALRGLSRATNYECRVRSRNEYGFSAFSKILYFRTFDFAHKKTKDDFHNSFVKANTFENNFPDTTTEDGPINANLNGFTKKVDHHTTITENGDLTNSVIRKPLATRRSQGYTGYSTASRTTSQITSGFQSALCLVFMLLPVLSFTFSFSYASYEDSRKICSW